MHSEITDNAEYLIMENIHTSAPRKIPIKQRELAQMTRTSLGMTNSILKRLTQKGWISIQKLNSRNIRYGLTRDGLNEIIRRSHNYFKRTINNISFYRNTINDQIRNASENGINTVLLIGFSDLEFILEHCCDRYGIGFYKSASQEIRIKNSNLNVMTVFSENIAAVNDTNSAESLYLSELILKSPVPL